VLTKLNHLENPLYTEAVHFNTNSNTAGSFANATATCAYKKTGDIVYMNLAIDIVDVGTATGHLTVDFPFISTNTTSEFYGRNSTTGMMVQGTLHANSSGLHLYLYDNSVAYSGANTIYVSGFYFIS